MISGLEGCEAIVDDILIWGTDMEEHDTRLRKVLDHVRDYNLRLSPDKCRFRQNHVTYVMYSLMKGLSQTTKWFAQYMIWNYV